MIKGVFFDLGGTLRICDPAPEHQQTARERMAFLAGRTDAEAFLQEIDLRYERDYRAWALKENRESGDFELWHKWLLPEMDEDRVREICHEMTYQYRQVKGKRRIVEGGLETIAALRARGFKLGIISNLIGETEIQNWLREDHLEQEFDCVVLSSITHLRKPDPEMYRIACRELNLKPQDCASIADNLNRDIVGAKAAGIGLNILLISPEKLAKKTITDENRPDVIVHQMTDVLKLPQLMGGNDR